MRVNSCLLNRNKSLVSAPETFTYPETLYGIWESLPTRKPFTYRETFTYPEIIYLPLIGTYLI